MTKRTLTVEYRYVSYAYYYGKAYFGMAEKES